MPIKQVVCSICKETVNKAVTYHVGGTDRACKKHQGVIEKKEALEQAKVVAKEREERKLERRLEQKYSPPEDWLKPKCWVCMNTGLRAQEFFGKLLIEMKKQQILKPNSNPLFGKDVVRLNERCIFVLPKEQGEPAMKYVREMFKDLVGMSGCIAICADCCGTCGIEPLKRDEAPSAEQLTAWMHIGALMDKPLREMAAQEMARDN